MPSINAIFAIIVLGAIAFLIAGALLPTALGGYYNGIQESEFINGSEALGRGNMSAIVATLLRLAPLGLPIAILLIFLAVGGLKLSGKM